MNVITNIRNYGVTLIATDDRGQRLGSIIVDGPIYWVTRNRDARDQKCFSKEEAKDFLTN